MLKAGSGRALWFVLSRGAALAVLVLLPMAVQAGWLDALVGAADRAASRLVRPGPSLEGAVRHVKTLPARGDAVAVAGEATQEGHWRFVNKAGETFTAGTPEEMKRAVSLLFPEARAGTRMAIYVTRDTIVRYPAAAKALPAGAELFVVAGQEAYRVLRRNEGSAERLFAEVRSSLVVDMTDAQVFQETAWQLARPLDSANVRVLAVEPGGPTILSASPRIDPASRRALVDTIDPGNLPTAMGAVAGQTLLITGRIERDLLFVKPSSGADRSLVLKDLFRAALAADVNLIVLHAASTPRQPGGRNWLWQTVEVKGLSDALQRAHVADFYNGLGATGRRLAVAAAPAGDRTTLEIKVASDLPGAAAPGQMSELFSGMVADMTGKVVVTGVLANVRSAERQQELDQRLLPGVPSAVQMAYVAAMVLGLFGVPVSRLWWQRIWPPEVADEYAGRHGFWAARAVRGLAYVAIFLPASAVVAAPYNLGTQVWDGVTTPLRWWRRLAGPKAGAQGKQMAAAAGDGAAGALGDRRRELPVLNPSALGQHRPNR